MTDDFNAPPQSFAVEQALIGALLLDNAAYDAVADLVRPDDFARREHRAIFEGIVARAAEMQPFDVLSLADALRSAGTLADAGGEEYLGELWSCTATSANVAHYARTVREKAALRAVIHACSTGAQLAATPGEQDSGEIIAEIESDLFRIAERRATTATLEPAASIAARVNTRVRAAAARKSALIGCSTGFIDLDMKTLGLEPGTLTILGARPSMGKTALACQIAQAVAMGENRPVAIFSMEMSADSLVSRMISNLARIDHSRLRAGRLSEAEWDAFADANAAIAAAPLRVDSTPALRSAEIRSRARRLRREQGDLALVVIDYLQLMAGGERSQNRNLELTAISRDVKTLATELSVPVIALSQLNRSLEQRSDKRPVMSDLRECLPVDEWVDTPSGPVPLGDRPQRVVGVSAAGPVLSDAEFIEKRYNRVYRVRTRYGDFRATARHRVLTGTGWKQVRELVPGRDVVASPRRIPHENRGPVPHGRLLGWLLSNGSLCGTPGLTYRKELHEAVSEAVAAFGVQARPRRTQTGSGVVDAYLSQGISTGSRPNPLMGWIRELGLEGCTAANKRVPARYLGSSEGTHIELLRGLWEGDGTVTGGEAKYTTISEVLARQVRWLLLTLGVRSKVSVEHKGPHAPLFVVRCARADHDALAPIVAHPGRFGGLSRPDAGYIDPSPAIFTELAAELAGEVRRFQRRQDGKLKRLARCDMESVLAEVPIKTILESPYLQQPGVGWGDVQSVELDGEADVRVCDLSVPGANCFVVNGVVVHNSGALEQDADLVWFLYRDEVYRDHSPDAGTAEIIIAKQRNGPIGVCRLAFQGRYVRFDNLAHPMDAAPPRSCHPATPETDDVEI